MRILWLSNVPLSKVRNHISNDSLQMGGWLDGMSDELLKDKNIAMMSIFPYKSKVSLEGEIENIQYKTFYNKYSDKNKSKFFKKVIEEFMPDIIHIFGTEYKHSLIMMRVCRDLNLLDKSVINVQGLCSKIGEKYYSNLPYNVVHAFTLRDLLRLDNIAIQKKKFLQRGKYEIEALQLVKNVIGRTDWDKACTTQINNKINYYYCDATLRYIFYSDNWNYDDCEKYSIFVSQCSYPIKGFHKLLDAMPLILQKFPNVKIYTTGKDLLNLSFKNKLKLSSYQKFLIKLIKKNNLQSHVIFLGMLDAENMKKAYLKSNCFVSCSSIENESNSLGEAMILGVPSVTSFVGGITSKFTNNEDGFAYPFDESYMLAHYICEIFSDKNLANKFSKNAKQHASEVYDKEKNGISLKEIYNNILRGNIK